MNIIIDIQAVKDKYNNFIPKEVAIASIESDCLGHWLVAPPHEFGALSPDIKRQNAWLERNYHGVAWEDGSTPTRDIENILKKIAVQADRIFTRGSDKSSYLERITGYYIINLEEDDEVPSLHNLPESGTLCVHHGLLCKNRKYKCALNNTIRIKSWLCHSERIDALWEYRTTTTWTVGLSEREHKEEDKEVLRKSSATVACYEQSSNFASSGGYTESYGRRISCGSYPEGVDETDGHCR